jgi:5'-nucleotidase
VSSASAAPADGTVELNILDINDFHGRIDANTVRFAATVEQLRAAAGDENTLFMSTGDNLGASLFASSVTEDQPTIDVLNALGLQASAVGNHEFDKGFADLTDRIVEKDGAPNADWDYLGANVYEKGTQTPALPEYALEEYGDLTVAVVGAVTIETPTLVSPAGVADLDFGDPVDAVNRVTGQLTDGSEANGEADVVIAAYHEGAKEGDADATIDEAIADSAVFSKIVTGTDAKVDAIFTGHTHMEYAWDAQVPGAAAGVTRPVLQTGSYGANVGHVVLTLDEESGALESYTAENVAQIAPVSEDDDAANAAQDAELAATYPRVAEVKDIVDEAIAAADVIGSQPKGTVAADITTAFSGGAYTDGVYTGGTRDDRASESTLGNLVADSLVSSLGSPERGGATIGVVNPGGLRSELLKGDDGVITYAEANAVLPFVNNLWTTSLSGEQFKAALEQQWQTDANGQVPSRAYLQLGLSDNVQYTYDADAAQGSHITGIWVDGEPIDPAASYRIGSFNFLLQGGDNFREFANGTDTRDSGLIDRDAWIAYLEANPNLAPDFARHAVEVTDAPAEAVKIGDDVTATVAKLDLTSLGSPKNTKLDVSWQGSAASFGTVDVVDGSATVTAEVPADAFISSELVLTAKPSGTVVRVPVTVSDGLPEPGRLAGETRYDTAVAASAAGWPNGAETVYVVSGEVYPDALSASPAAAGADAPILLTPAGALPEKVAAEVDRLSPASIIIVGGTNSVSPAVETALAGIADVTRIQGADRYETSRKVAAEAFPDGANEAIVAAGANFADALSAGAAIDGDGPVILVNGTAGSLDTPTAGLIESLDAGEIAVVGGEKSVSAGIFGEISDLTDAVRLGGADRYESSRLINEHFFDSADRVLLVSGQVFPDALSGSGLAPKWDAPLFTVPGTCVPADTLDQITALGAKDVTLLGGANTLSAGVEELTVCK